MTTCQVQASGAIELLFYGELADRERTFVEAHIRECADCRRALDDLDTIREALASRSDIAAPPGEDWSGFMTRLDAAVRQEGSGLVASSAERSIADAGPRRLRQGFGESAVALRAKAEGRAYAYLAIAAALTLVTIAVLLLARQPDDVTGTLAELPAGPAAVENAVRAPEPLDQALTSVGEQHFERSKLVVLGLATKDPGGGAGSNWAYEQELASTLLDDTRLYRMAAEDRGMNTLAGVMRDLELLLLEASMSEQPDAESLETLQQLIRRRDLLTKMEVVKTSGL